MTSLSVSGPCEKVNWSDERSRKQILWRRVSSHPPEIRAKLFHLPSAGSASICDGHLRQASSLIHGLTLLLGHRWSSATKQQIGTGKPKLGSEE
ncbi:hypothetical protein RRG08_032497 [Elysia crispata]|uniref:Uncharacterized protein n=1 Tax=Elysia crispata TaxID=231223 RepID=A0AAE0ZY20_9GAST|nr:hypothetical protein RRG08_032497 [Elysia crispata]